MECFELSRSRRYFEIHEIIFNAILIKVSTDTLVPLGSKESNSGLTSAQAWDYLHINSVDKDKHGDYLLSARHFSTIFKINGTDGSIIWRLGGKHPDFKQIDDWTFGFQHHARWHPQFSKPGTEVFSFFDNSGDGTIAFNNVSRALIVEVNHRNQTARILRKATAPYGLQAQSQGNAQLLSDGRIFVNWGSAGAFTEFNSNNEVIYHAFIEQDAVSYRGFISNWTGTPVEEPALVAVQSSSSQVKLHVSWNGDTETVAWKFFYAKTDNGSQKRSLIGQVQRKSFETVFTWDSPHALTSTKFYAQAVGKDDALLTQTIAVKAYSGI